MINVYTFRRMASFGAAAGLAVVLALPINIDAKQAPAPGACRITGHATSGPQPLPGVAISIKSGPALKAATSTDQDGSYGVSLTPGQYTIAAELTGFGRVEQTITVATDGSSSSAAATEDKSPAAAATGDKCSQTLNIPMTLAPRSAACGTSAAPVPQGSRLRRRRRPRPRADAARSPNAGGRGAAPAGRNARGNQRQQVQCRRRATTRSRTRPRQRKKRRLLLPPGFSSAPADAIAQRQRDIVARRDERSLRRDWPR